MKKTFYWVASFVMCTMATSCSSDDDNGLGNGEATDFPIPSSVVDGVRPESVAGTNIDYNADGSINQATCNGQVYKFVYEETRATSTGKKLEKIVCSYKDRDGYYENIEATNFKFNSDGFISGFRYQREDGYPETSSNYFWEKSTFDYSYKYNGTGRMSGQTISGKSESYDKEDGHNSASGKFSIKYNYSGNTLISSSTDYYDAGMSITFDYDENIPNKYNIMTPHLAFGISLLDDDLCVMLAMAGYLGNASDKLPTKMTEVYSEDEDDDEVYVTGLKYTFDSSNRISTIQETDDYGYTETFRYSYFQQ